MVHKEPLIAFQELLMHCAINDDASATSTATGGLLCTLSLAENSGKGRFDMVEEESCPEESLD